ncbi:MAG TPA: protein kinase [Ktedonobacteraceae bacterium]
MQQMETLPAGTILYGRYKVERALGSGGFGHVYLCADLQSNNTQYAIKEYLVAGANGKAQLEHEAQVLSHLHHPNLPAFLSAFDENGRYYVILGYIEGNDLTDYLRVVRQKNEPLPIARLMEWLLSICDAVAFLHSQRPPIIHRDIKPDNIRITPNGTAILVDLGNAKTAADGARTLFFIRHQGTPGYAPLEQYPGGTGTDERSDVYALGGTLYFALTAHEPPSVSARNQSLQQKQPDLPTLQDRLAQNPPDNQQEPRQFRLGVSKPSKPVPRHSRHVAQLGALPPELLRKLDAIIQRAMAMKPKDRYQTVTELSNDLRMVLRALPTSTLPAAANRPVDPHSTQPDLPMLYESLQAQAQAQAQAVQAIPPVQPISVKQQQMPPVQPPSIKQQMPPAQSTSVKQQQIPSTPQPAPTLRCPNCRTELTRPAPYCPNCGHPLNPPNPPKGPAGRPDPASQQASRSTQQDISEEATMRIPPGSPPQEPPGPNRRSSSFSAQASASRGGTNANLPTLRAARQQMLKTPSQSVPPPGPEQNLAVANLNQNTHTPARIAQAQIPGATTSTSGTYTAINQNGTASQNQPLNEQIQIPSHLSAPATPSIQPEGLARKLFISVAIIVAVLIIVMLLLIVFLQHNHGSGPKSSIHSILFLTQHIFARLTNA